MTPDEIEAIFWGDQREQPTRVRLARVVRALHDELGFDPTCCFDCRDNLKTLNNLRGEKT